MRVMSAGQQLVLQLWHAGAVTSALSRRALQMPRAARGELARDAAVIECNSPSVVWNYTAFNVQITFLLAKNDKKHFLSYK